MMKSNKWNRNLTGRNCTSQTVTVLCVIVVTLAFSRQAVAHDPAAAPPDDPDAWKKSVALNFNLTRGNSDTLLLNLGAKASREKDKNIWHLAVDGNYGESDTEGEEDDDTTQQDLSASVQYKRLLNERLYGGLGMSFRYDDIANIDYRILLNSALGYFLVKKDTVRLSGELGPSYVFEKLEGKKDDYFAPRAGERFEWDISDNARFYQAAQYLFSIDDSDKYLVDAEAGIEASINSHLSLVMTLKNRYDNQPARGKERNDLSVLTGLKVNF